MKYSEATQHFGDFAQESVDSGGAGTLAVAGTTADAFLDSFEKDMLPTCTVTCSFVTGKL